MPKIICKVCNGTKDANYDLPSDEYIHYPCQSCKNGIENFCSACDGEGTYWTYGGLGDNAYLHWCSACNGNGYKLDSIQVEEECVCVKKGPELHKKQEEEFAWLKDFFEDHIYTVSHVKHHKPSPDIFIHAAKQLGVEPHLCIAIEDTATGLKAAKDAGMFCIGINTGNNKHALKEAHLIVDGYHEIDLPALLEQVHHMAQ